MCRRQAELGTMPCHNWTHGLRMWWNDKVRACTRGPEPPEPFTIGMSSIATGLAGVALASLAGKLRKDPENETRTGRPVA